MFYILKTIPFIKQENGDYLSDELDLEEITKRSQWYLRL